MCLEICVCEQKIPSVKCNSNLFFFWKAMGLKPKCNSNLKYIFPRISNKGVGKYTPMYLPSTPHKLFFIVKIRKYSFLFFFHFPQLTTYTPPHSTTSPSRIELRTELLLRVQNREDREKREQDKNAKKNPPLPSMSSSSLSSPNAVEIHFIFF